MAACNPPSRSIRSRAECPSDRGRRPSSRSPHACETASTRSRASARTRQLQCATREAPLSSPRTFCESFRRGNEGPSRAAPSPRLLSSHRHIARTREGFAGADRRRQSRAGCGGYSTFSFFVIRSSFFVVRKERSTDNEERITNNESRIVAASGNAFALADAHLGHCLNQFSAGCIGALERLTQQLHLIALLFCGDCESVRRLFGTIRRRSPPRAIDQLAADVVISFSGLKTERRCRRNAAGVCLLFVERARDAIGNQLPQHGARVAGGVGNAKARVVDALLRGALRQTKERIVNDLAIDLDRLSFPGQRDVAALTDCRKASLMRDADAFDRRINEENTCFADSPRERSRQLHT